METPLSSLRSINRKVGPCSHWYLDTGISCTQYFAFFRWGFDRSTSRFDPAEGSCLYPPAVVVWIPFSPMVSASTLVHLLSSFSILDLSSTFQQQFGSLCSRWSRSHINTQSKLLQSCCRHPNLLHYSGCILRTKMSKWWTPKSNGHLGSSPVKGDRHNPFKPLTWRDFAWWDEVRATQHSPAHQLPNNQCSACKCQ